MTQRLPSPRRFIYVIGPETGYQKVGIATDPRSRLAALQTASPAKLRIHTSVAVPFGAAHDVERRAHFRLRAVRAAGEWFDVAPAEAAATVEAAAATHFSLLESHEALPLFAMALRPLPIVPTARLSLLEKLGRLWGAS